ncbi:Transforming growth factor-beta receptor-associated protein 1 [Ceratocystis platani]|uniref:Transforming growth factor-beta receptor-associated protein 1 n=1 Tax=Ceratocystis fimbriata f. sp. platani TaxID=88771 RepID=A0A0F8B4U7_CERFI|nr:Transforming growth factor-beta receptor-associated protein 1 [Ceratocystis platani]
MSGDEVDAEKPLPVAPISATSEDGPFVLRTLMDEVPLATEGMSDGIKINCIEFYGQLLHFVHIPADSSDASSSSSFIMASRLEPDYAESTNSAPGSRPGVQQILLLPKVGKACVLCNWTVTFYMLPEFSRALGTLQVKNCNWIGGVDLNESRDPDDYGYDGKPGVTLMMSLNKRIQIVRILDEAKLVRNIDFAGSTMSIRRDSIACVADNRSYALLDIDHQLKIPLMPIFSLDDTISSGDMGRTQAIGGNSSEGLEHELGRIDIFQNQLRYNIRFYHTATTATATKNSRSRELKHSTVTTRWAFLCCKHSATRPGFALMESFKNREARSELEFLTFNYLRQRAGLVLLFELLGAEQNPDLCFSDAEIKSLEEILVESVLDPRVVLSLIPGVCNEIIESKMGIWVFGGVREAVIHYLSNQPVPMHQGKPVPAIEHLSSQVLHFLRRFLVAWRRRKGFGSVAGEKEVFQTVDAALLLVLLEIDQHSPVGLAKSSRSPRAELYEVVDKGIDCFDRAVEMLEAYNRLFVLSRLYQSRKMAREVLATWKRIVEGEVDEGGELMDGEQRVRDYLSKVGNLDLVREYGLWLANRNPALGVEVFAEEKRAKNGIVGPRFEPTDVVHMLKAKAPGAVKAYLEHMVFTKGHSLYINDLISYFLDSVFGHLQASKENREALAATYTAYRALQPPKPSYGRFLADNLVQDGDEAWRNRLRLLQLLSTARGYDAEAIHRRIAELPGDLLVPETIILAGKAKQHSEAIRLLVHSLGDYDTAVTYCIRGGRSIYGSPSRYSALQQTLASPTSHNFPMTDSIEDQDEFADSEALFKKQKSLFLILLGEFLVIENSNHRVEQTSTLLERYGPWFELKQVLERVPDSWPLEPLGPFLIGALRRIVREQHQAMVQKALCAAQSLRISEELIEARARAGPTVKEAKESDNTT